MLIFEVCLDNLSLNYYHVLPMNHLLEVEFHLFPTEVKMTVIHLENSYKNKNMQHKIRFIKKKIFHFRNKIVCYRLKHTHQSLVFHIMPVYRKQDSSTLVCVHSFEETMMHRNIANANTSMLCENGSIGITVYE